MPLERTLRKIRGAAASRAAELGSMAYLQWLASLPGGADYRLEAMGAYLTALPEVREDAAIAVFCDLLRRSMLHPLTPLPLVLATRQRHGGQRARRSG